jgi:hypothetical protein
VESKFSVQKIGLYLFFLIIILVFTIKINLFYEEEVEKTVGHSISTPSEVSKNSLQLYAGAAVQRRGITTHKIRVPSSQLTPVLFAVFYAFNDGFLCVDFNFHFVFSLDLSHTPNFKRYLRYCIFIF